MLDTRLGWFYFRGMKMKVKSKRSKAESKRQRAKDTRRKANGKRQKRKAEERLVEGKKVGYFFECFGEGGAQKQLWETVKLALVADKYSSDEREH